MNSDRSRLGHIIEAIATIEEFVAGGENAFFESKLIQSGVVRQLEIIGEAVKHLSAGLREGHPDVEWRRIGALRDRLIHAYFGIRINRVWKIVQTDIPALRQRIAGILSAIED